MCWEEQGQVCVMLSDAGSTCTHLPGCQHMQAHMANTCLKTSEGVDCGWEKEEGALSFHRRKSV